MKKWLILLFCLPLLLTGCQSSPGSSDTVSWEPSVESFDISLPSLITKEQASDIMNTTFDEGMLMEEGQSLVFLSEDTGARLDILLSKETRADYDAILSMGYTDLIVAPNIGEVAYWSPESCDLLLYQQGYFLTVHTQHPDFSNDRLLTAAREVAIIVLEKL